ncbi:PfkB family carbohydrate kinase [Scrofimicrobium sp. R131]|uniref:pyridoxal kinase n=1 Tax=Scrofimicrobium appendicitidis TaxID=3079930 RepID=A0AAU7V9K6_9ACTO
MPEQFYTTDAGQAQQLELDVRLPQVLAFGSQLLHGSVGLNAALPIYSAAGIRASSVPTILLSNLPHYPSVQTLAVAPEWIRGALTDLAATGALTDLSAVTSGYLAIPAQAEVVANWLEQRHASSQPWFVLDPTLGDADVGFYTDPAVGPAVREYLVPRADVITPNLFELAQLSGAGTPPDGQDLSALVAMARQLTDAGAKSVVVTGVPLDADRVQNVVVTASEVQVSSSPRLTTGAKGLGDVFTAGLTAALVAGAELPEAVIRGAAQVNRAIEQRRLG